MAAFSAGEGAAEPALIRQREQATREALRCLDDVAYLAQSALAELMAEAQGKQPEGHDIQQALRRAIEAVRPVAGQPSRPRQQRHYAVLCQTYLEKKRPPEVAVALSISERQYYRRT